MSVLDTTDALDVAGYAAAVRRSLADLGPEQVDDLTDDLEADLAEALDDERHVAHGRGLLEQFGPPEDYAAELRAAAGLAPATAPARRGAAERPGRRHPPVRPLGAATAARAGVVAARRGVPDRAAARLVAAARVGRLPAGRDRGRGVGVAPTEPCGVPGARRAR